MNSKVATILVSTLLIVLIGSLFILKFLEKNNEFNDNSDQFKHEELDTGSVVIAYHPCYQWDHIDTIPWDRITHLGLGYQLLERISSSNYSINAPSWYSSSEWRNRAKEYASEAHDAGDKIICHIGGAGSNPDNIWQAATSEANVKKFAENIKNYLEPLGFDGVDLNWENNIDYTDYLRLIRTMREVWPDAIINIPTSAYENDASIFAAVKNEVDAFLPMIYISVQQWGGWLIPVPLTPLHGVPHPNEHTDTNPYSVDIVLNRWLAAGVPASKILMGVGGFGTVWGDSNNDGRGPIAPYSNTNINEGVEGETRCLASDNTVTWKWVREIVENHKEFSEGWDDVGKCSYWHTSSPNELVTVTRSNGATLKISLIFYETSRSISEKIKYITNNGMQGMGFWTLAQMIDNHSSPILESITL